MTPRFVWIACLTALGWAEVSAAAPRTAFRSAELDTVTQWLDASRNAEAESLATLLLQGARARTPPDSFTMARSLGAIARSRWGRKMMRDSVAVTAAGRSLAIESRLAPRDSLALAAAEYLLGRVLFESSRPDSAIGHFDRALAWRVPKTGETDSLVAAIYFSRGQAHRRLRALVPSLESLRHAREIRTRLYGPESVAVAGTLAEEGGALLDLDRFDEARAALERALEIDQRVLAPGDINIVYPLNLLSMLEYRMGDLAGSLDHLHQALDVEIRVHGEQEIHTQPFRYNIGLRLVDLGDYTEADEMFAQVLAAFETTYGAGQFRTENARMMRGVTAALLGDTTRARTDLQQALASFEKAAADPSGAWSHALRWLAYLETVNGRPAEGEQLIDRAIALERRNTRPSLETLAALYQTAEGIEEAAGDTAALARSVRDIAELTNDATPLGTIARVIFLGTRVAAEVRLGRTSDAWAHALEATAMEREHLRANVRALPDRQAMALASNASESLDRLIGLASSGTADQRATAWDRLIRWRGLVTAEIGRRRLPAGSDTALVAGHERWIAAQQRYAQAMVASAPGSGDAEAARRSELWRTEAESAEREYARVASGLGASAPAPDPSLDEVLARLPAGAGLVSLWEVAAQTDTARIVAFVARGRGEPRLLDLGRTRPLRERVDRWVTALGSPPDPARARAAELAARRAGELVRKQTWDRLAEALGGCREVFVVGDGPLRDLPWHALPVGPRAYLVEQDPLLHQLDAERDLADPDAAPVGRGLLAVGGPRFDAGAPNSAGPMLAASAMRGPLGKCRVESGLALFPLPAARAEVEEAGRTWNAAHPEQPATVLVDAEASEAAFKRDAPGRAIVHLATHGILWGDSCAPTTRDLRGVGGVGPLDDARAGPRAESRTVPLPPGFGPHPSPWLGRQVWLALAGARGARNGAPDANEGLLTAEEVVTLDLRGVDWVVLSACRSGVGRSWPHEGAEGMRRAFRLAGARTVIASQWNLGDESAREWMRDLYAARVAGTTSAAVAMRDANRTFLAARRAGGRSTHPFYWAAFSASGR